MSVIAGFSIGLFAQPVGEMLFPTGSIYISSLSRCLLPVLFAAFVTGLAGLLRDPAARRAFIADHTGRIDKPVAQYLVREPLLKAVLHRFVVLMVLRRYLLLCGRIENPEGGVGGLAGGRRLVDRGTRRDMFDRKTALGMFPPLIAWPQCSTDYRRNRLFKDRFWNSW